MLWEKKINREGDIEDSGKNQNNLKEQRSRDRIKATQEAIATLVGVDCPWTRRIWHTCSVIEGKEGREVIDAKNLQVKGC